MPFLIICLLLLACLLCLLQIMCLSDDPTKSLTTTTFYNDCRVWSAALNAHTDKLAHMGRSIGALNLRLMGVDWEEIARKGGWMPHDAFQKAYSLFPQLDTVARSCAHDSRHAYYNCREDLMPDQFDSFKAMFAESPFAPARYWLARLLALQVRMTLAATLSSIPPKPLHICAHTHVHSRPHFIVKA